MPEPIEPTQPSALTFADVLVGALVVFTTFTAVFTAGFLVLALCVGVTHLLGLA